MTGRRRYGSVNAAAPVAGQMGDDAVDLDAAGCG